jgi:hypothetical protein
VASYQTALIVVYALTTYLFFTQYHRTRSVPLLVLAVGGLFTTLVVLVQLLTFPNIFAPGRLLGGGPDTTTWLWTFWHIGPLLFALLYAIMDGNRRSRQVAAQTVARFGWLSALATLVVVGLITLLVTRYVHLLPKSVDGDDY